MTNTTPRGTALPGPDAAPPATPAAPVALDDAALAQATGGITAAALSVRQPGAAWPPTHPGKEPTPP